MQVLELTDQLSFPNFSANSRVWVYQADREITEQEHTEMETAVQQYADTWQVHGQDAIADSAILFNRFIVFVVSESMPASGCSIDESVRFIHQLGNKTSIDFFNRLQICYRLPQSNIIASLSISEFKKARKAGEIPNGSIVFNNTITTLKEFKEAWMIAVEDSWLA